MALGASDGTVLKHGSGDALRSVQVVFSDAAGLTRCGSRGNVRLSLEGAGRYGAREVATRLTRVHSANHEIALSALNGTVHKDVSASAIRGVQFNSSNAADVAHQATRCGCDRRSYTGMCGAGEVTACIAQI